MKQYIIFTIVVLSIQLVSCTKNISPVDADSADKIDESISYTVPFETALNSLDIFMREQGLISDTKGSINHLIDNHFIVKNSLTKSIGTQTDLLYAVNFVDEGGYALLSADSRIGEDILAVVEKGTVHENDFVLSDYNLTPTENDDLSTDSYEDMVESGVLAMTEINTQINHLCLSYAQHEVGDYFSGGSVSNSGNGSVSENTSNPVTYQWQIEEQVPRMLTTAWTQEGKNQLFNKYCPEVGLIWRRKAPAGCVCIAVSQIIAHHEFPASLSCNDMTIDYSAIKDIYCYRDINGTGTAASQEMLARFIINVGGWCNTQYHSIFGYSWGFAWPWNARDCLSLFGYENASLNWSYNENQVINALNDGCPVFMSAISGVISGHAWVIDGYIKRKYVSSTGSVLNNQTLVHCNWGWHGDCNGYFTSGVFKSQQAVITDGFGQYQNENYWYAFNTVTYDNPNK